MPDRRSPEPAWADPRLVRECLKGNSAAWSALVDKYKNLVFGIILNSGVPAEEATDLFQSIWLDAYNDLHKLRKKAAFKAWLVALSKHKCYHWRQRHRQRGAREVELPEDLEALLATPPAFDADLERDQLVREAIFALPARCREMIRLLFFTFPPQPYQEVAKRLGLATGSIGFIRRRCLQRLQRLLEKHGVS